MQSQSPSQSEQNSHLMEETTPCLLPLSGTTQQRQTPNICSISRIYRAKLTKLPPGANLGFNITPAQVVSTGARDVNTSLRSRPIRGNKPVSKPSAKEDSLAILFATANQCSSVMMKESEAKKRQGLREEADIAEEEAAAVFAEGIVLAAMGSDVKKAISETKRKSRDIYDMHDYLRSRLEDVLQDFIQ